MFPIKSAFDEFYTQYAVRHQDGQAPVFTHMRGSTNSSMLPLVAWCAVTASAKQALKASGKVAEVATMGRQE